MKKVLSVTLASAMAVVTLAGCGGGNSAQQTKTAETAATTAAGATEAAESTKTGDQEPVTIRFSWWGGESRHKATLEAVDAFMKEIQPGETVNVCQAFSLNDMSPVTLHASDAFGLDTGITAAQTLNLQ